jgi:hypothetical protein
LASERGIDVNNPANLDRWISVGYSKKQSGSVYCPPLAAYSGAAMRLVFHWGFSEASQPNWQ